MIALDTTVFIQATNTKEPKHAAARRLLHEGLNNEPPLVVAPQVLLEFIHVATDPRRFASPFSMERALDLAVAFSSSQKVFLAGETTESLRLANEWMRRFKLGRKRVLDTHLAATYHLHGCKRLLTSNPDDFKIFGVFELITP